MKSKVKVAFYKGKKGFISKLICWYKDAKYSHCELVYGGYCFSSSEVDGKVRRKKINLREETWDVIDIPWLYAPGELFAFFRKHEGKKYDFKGIILSQIFGHQRHNPNKYFCSEFCAEAIGLRNPQRFDPQGLYDLLIFGNDIILHRAIKADNEKT